MPELPEVETVARQLAPWLEGRRARALRILDPRLRAGPPPRLPGRRVTEVGRSGKQVLIGFSPAARSGSPVWLAVHLRMTGRLIWKGRSEGIEQDHLRARITFDRGSLLFYDTRRFGTWTWHASRAEAAPAGVDPLSPDLSAAGFAAMIGASRQNVKAWLMRQDRLVGLGNIYASEILHAAGISPHRTTDSLVVAENRRLYGTTRRILRRAIERCGTTFSDFQDARGETGSYQRYLAVYGREGEACRRCGGTIERLVQQQRSTYHCPGCQAAEGPRRPEVKT